MICNARQQDAITMSAFVDRNRSVERKDPQRGENKKKKKKSLLTHLRAHVTKGDISLPLVASCLLRSTALWRITPPAVLGLDVSECRRLPPSTTDAHPW
jgi:hypothetical protein